MNLRSVATTLLAILLFCFSSHAASAATPREEWLFTWKPRESVMLRCHVLQASNGDLMHELTIRDGKRTIYRSGELMGFVRGQDVYVNGRETVFLAEFESNGETSLLVCRYVQGNIVTQDITFYEPDYGVLDLDGDGVAELIVYARVEDDGLATMNWPRVADIYQWQKGKYENILSIPLADAWKMFKTLRSSR